MVSRHAPKKLLHQHVIVRPDDLSRINTAFFTANGFVSVALAVSGIADVLIKGS